MLAPPPTFVHLSVEGTYKCASRWQWLLALLSGLKAGTLKGWLEDKQVSLVATCSRLPFC